MRIGPFTFTTTKAYEKAIAVGALASVPGSRGWWPIIREFTTGGWQRNETIPLDTVLSNPTLYACVTLIARDIGKMRIKLVEQQASGVWVEVDSPAFSPFLRKPNHYQNHIEFKKWWMISKLVHGQSYVLKQRDGRNVVTAGYVLDPTRVTPLVAESGDVFYELQTDELSLIPRGPIVVPAREMMHDKCEPLFHPLVGVSPIYAAGWPALFGLTIRRNSETFFANNAKPGGVLSAPGTITDATADRLKQYWSDEFSGTNNIGKIAVLGDGLKFEHMAMTAEQSDLVAQLHQTDEDICRAFHMPRHKVGVGPDPSFNNVAALAQQYLTDCLQDHIESMELTLDEGLELTLVPGRTLGTELDTSALVRMDPQAQMTFAKDGIASAIFSPNEARALFDQPPTAGGESPMLQQQMFSLEALAVRDENDPFSKPDTPTAPPDAMPTADAAPDETKALTVAEYLSIREAYLKEFTT